MRSGDIIYHYTQSFDRLLSILRGGFLASYADEKIGGRDVKILMVSFSNHSYFDSINELTYGNYAIGLSSLWAKTRQLNPVAYTHSLSLMESALLNIMEHCVIGQAVDVLSRFPEEVKKGFVFDNEGTNRLKEINWDRMSRRDLSIFQLVFADLFADSIELIKNFKQIEVKTKEGKAANSFLDREWRFLPDLTNIGMPSLIYKTNKNKSKINPEWIKWKETTKPHQKEASLKFSLSDIRYIITNHKMEIGSVYTQLNKIYGEEKVNYAVLQGELLVTSKYHLTKQI